ncbi:MAG: glycosyltransferase family 2 protein [Bifidobacterium psychraerophilum]|jgi:glycosyltransferase involved in cell wall biosynthesis|uniref:glycosyltransferase family 2 protein n=1 Tax=Bifidobacterium psychraerophilum TaxID=218140 RepID=UPI0023F694A7|nr:glycosyltransferase family 2 protein [Bifidobacterium psychraerophilum]MCI2182368.1 glycosyltransferase family 2 protein [Bifidobacterium psychraerophilum]
MSVVLGESPDLYDGKQLEKSDVAVIIPCFNEAITIEKVVKDFRTALPLATVYVYDNNSSDNTAEIAAKAGAVVRREPRQGKGNVVRAMFNEIDADAYIMVDGDDTYPAESAPEMVKKILGGYDMVIGDRLSSTYFEQNKRAFHGFGNKLVRWAINAMFNSEVQDIMTGYRAFSRQFVKTYPCLSKGFEIETEMTIHSLDKNVRICELPVQYRDRPEGSESKLDTIGDGIKVLSTIFHMIREYKPLPFFGILGVIFGVLGFGIFLPVVYEFWRSGLVLRFPTLIVSVLLMLLGILMVVTGIILDVLAEQDRKRFIVDSNMFMQFRN